MSNSVEQKSSGGRIDIVDFWRFFAAIMVIFCHIYMVGGIKVQSHFFVEFFFMLSGFFIFRHFRKEDNRHQSIKDKLKNAIHYSWKKYLKVLPYTIPIVILCSLPYAYLFYAKTHYMPDTIKYLINMFLEPFMFPAHASIMGRWFIVPIWYLSVMMFFTPLISFVAQLRRKEWLFFIMIPIAWIYLSTVAEIHDNFGVSSAMAMIRGVVPMLMGGVIYYLVERININKFNNKKRILFTLLEMFLYAAMATAAFNNVRTGLIVLLAFFAILLTVSGLSYTSKIKCKYLSVLGGISLPLFMWHFGLIRIVSFFDSWGMTRKYVVVFLGSIIISAIHYGIVQAISKRRQKKQPINIKAGLRKIFKWFILLSILAVFGLATIQGVLATRNTFYTPYKPYILIVGVIVFLVIAKFFYQFIKKIKIKNDKVAVIACCVYFCLLLVFGLLIKSIPSLDLNHVITEANRLVVNRNAIVNDYFDYHPHQRPLLLIVYVFYKIASYLPFVTGSQLMVFINVACIAVSAYLLYRTVAIKFNRNMAFFILCLFFLWPIFWLKASFYYTDTLVLPFIMLAIYLFTDIAKNSKTKHIYSKLFFAGLASYIAYKIRAPGIFVLVAYVVYLLFVVGLKGRLTLELFKRVACVVLGLIVGLVGISTSLMMLNFGDSTEKALSPLHYISMGMNHRTGGIYNYNDYRESKMIDTSAERTEMNIARLKKRVGSLGPRRLLGFAATKVKTMWSQGDTNSRLFLDSLETYYPFSEFFVNSKRSIMLSYYIQIFHLSVLILFCVAILRSLREEKLDFIYIFIFGAALLYLLWEVQPRYNLSFMPAILLMAPIAFQGRKKPLEVLRQEWSGRIWLISKLVLIGVFVAVAILNFGPYCRRNKQIDVVALSNYENNEQSALYLKSGDTLSQTFSTIMPFNNVVVYFAYDKEYQDLDKYAVRLTLEDENKHVTTSIERPLDEIKPESANYFELPETFANNKNGRITIETSAPAEAKFETALSFNESEGYNYDTIIDGKCMLNNKEFAGGDLRIKLLERQQQSVYKPSFYIVVNIICLALLMFCLFIPSKKNNAPKLSAKKKTY